MLFTSCMPVRDRFGFMTGEVLPLLPAVFVGSACMLKLLARQQTYTQHSMPTSSDWIRDNCSAACRKCPV